MLRIRLSALLLLLFAAPLHAELLLVPEPAEVTAGTGRFPFGRTVTIAVASRDPEDRFAAGLLEEEIEARAPGVDVRVTDGASGDVVLARDAPAAVGDEGYRLEAGPRGVKIAGRTAAGVFYGVQTLRQMVDTEGIDAATIVDRPALRWRGLHDDVSRGPMPTMDALKRRIRTAAEYKFNLFALYLETAFAYRSQPLLAPPGGELTAAQVRELAEYGRLHHVTVMLEQQTFGHLERLVGLESYRELGELPTGGMLSPANPKSYVFVDSMLRELAPLTDAPFLHVGGDEIAELGRGQSKSMVANAGLGPTYLAHLRRLRDLVKPLGKRAMVWGDALLEHRELIPQVPREMVVATWDYQVRDRYDDSIKPFRDAGLDLFACSGIHNWNRVFPNLDQALPNLRGMARDGQRLGALGSLVCTWDDNGDALFGLGWYPVLFGAASAWQSGGADPERFRRAFDWAYFRHPGHEIAEAIDRINSAHGRINKVRPTDVTIELSWLNPAGSDLDRRLLLMLEPAAAPLRLAQEEAIARIERARPWTGRNADQLDYLEFAARRIHAIGTRAQIARRLTDLYRTALDNQTTERSPQAVIALQAMVGAMNQGRENAAVLRSEYERLWLAENRPYWLANVLSQYDNDLRVWTAKSETIRERGVLMRSGRPLPGAEQLGLGP